MQVGMTGPDRIAKRSPDVFPRRSLVDPEKGKQRLFIRGASQRLKTLRCGVALTRAAAAHKTRGMQSFTTSAGGERV
jgi:hypothetical protein